MTGTQTLIARSVLGCVLAPLSAWLAANPRFDRLSPRAFDRLVSAALIVSRLAFFVLLYKILHLAPRGDIPAYYVPQAVAALAHKIPYRDFESSYAPLHPYLDALLVAAWRSSLPIILFAMLAEFLLLPNWLRLGRKLFSEDSVRAAALLYVASPLSLQFVAVDGQDNVFVGLLLLLALACALRFRYILSAASLAASIVAVKFLPLVFTPAFFVGLRGRWRWALTGLAIVVPVYAAFAALHAPILQPVQAEGELRTASNLPYFIESLLNVSIPGTVSNLFVVVALLAITAVVAQACRNVTQAGRVRIITLAIPAVTFALLLFSKKSWPTYLMLCLFPVCLLPVLQSATRSHLLRRLAAFAVFSIIAVTEHSIWASIFDQPTSAATHSLLASARPAAILFFAAEFLLIVSYVWLLWECIRAIQVTAVTHQVDLTQEDSVLEPAFQLSRAS